MNNKKRSFKREIKCYGGIQGFPKSLASFLFSTHRMIYSQLMVLIFVQYSDVLYICPIYRLPVLTRSTEEIHSFLVKGLLKADNTQLSRALQGNVISIGLDENSLEQRSVPSYCKVPQTEKKEKVEGNSGRNREESSQRGFWVGRSQQHQRPPARQTCPQVSCLLLPSGLETLNFPSLGPQFWFNPENKQETG